MASISPITSDVLLRTSLLPSSERLERLEIASRIAVPICAPIVNVLGNRIYRIIVVIGIGAEMASLKSKQGIPIRLVVMRAGIAVLDSMNGEGINMSW